MPVGLYFQPTGFTKERYDEANKQLEAAGAGFGSVPGRRFHCAMEVGETIQVFDVWESMEQFQKFGEVDFEHKPNRTLRWLVTARVALRDLGIEDGERHLMVATSGGWDSTTATIVRG